MISAVSERGTLYWRRETGLGSTQKDSDAGPAWVIEADGTEREINDGGWITRLEAERLAGVGEYTLKIET
jgi:hypothetical protein